jgi:hypothetical protein
MLSQNTPQYNHQKKGSYKASLAFRHLSEHNSSNFSVWDALNVGLLSWALQPESVQDHEPLIQGHRMR